MNEESEKTNRKKEKMSRNITQRLICLKFLDFIEGQIQIVCTFSLGENLNKYCGSLGSGIS
jgi:hypothetical protein